jgi:O-antigen ligase
VSQEQEGIVGAVMIVALLALALYGIWRQIRELRVPGGPGDPQTIEGRYRRARVRRRLISSGLILILAGQLAGALLFLEEPAREQANRADERAGVRERGEQPVPPTAEERSFARFYGSYWVVFLLVLLCLVALAFSDLWATRSFGVRAHRQLQAERREMIDRQIARLREEKRQRSDDE